MYMQYMKVGVGMYMQYMKVGVCMCAYSTCKVGVGMYVCIQYMQVYRTQLIKTVDTCKIYIFN